MSSGLAALVLCTIQTRHCLPPPSFSYQVATPSPLLVELHAAFMSAARGWWKPSLAEYLGRESDLPVDGHAVLALIAPRYALVATAHNDHEGDITFANEMSYQHAQQVYSLLNASDALRITYRPGDHHGFLDVNVYFDWYDAARRGDTHGFPESLLHAFSWQAWNSTATFDRTPPPEKAPLADRMAWLLGEDPPRIFSAGSSE